MIILGLNACYGDSSARIVAHGRLSMALKKSGSEE
jgi:hypothetical protein